MSFTPNSFISQDAVYWKGILRKVKRSKTALQPIFEAFTNALEAIELRRRTDEPFNPTINIGIRVNAATDGTTVFDLISIEDNGIGFTDDEFKRFNRYQDYTKGFKNRGSGRIQYAHYFVRTNFESHYNSTSGLRMRKFVVSKDEEFLNNNAIVRYLSDEESSHDSSGTRVVFNRLVDNSRAKYHTLTDVSLKGELVSKYLLYFSILEESQFPAVNINYYVNGERQNTSSLTKSDFPVIDETKPIELPFMRLNHDASGFEPTGNFAQFRLDTFKIPPHQLDENQICLISKSEIVSSSSLDINGVSRKDVINGHRYLALISGDYIDDRDSDERGELEIPSRDDDLQSNAFTEEEVFIEDIHSSACDEINALYPEILTKKEEHQQSLDRLKEMFLLSDEEIDSDTPMGQSAEQILQRAYKAEATRVAKLDAHIKESIDKLDSFDPSAEDYSDKMKEELDRLVALIPIQNRTALTHYVARRRLVLELFDKILQRQLQTQQSGRNNDEQLLHNLLFQQSSSNPEESDLWLINEDFVFFKGTSETRLEDVKVKGSKILRSDLSDEERGYLESFNRRRLTQRPDILIFPEEAKCIIIELKNPDKSIEDHIGQISAYAGLLLNFATPEFKFDTFYGYLLGEDFHYNDVRITAPAFKQAYHYDYLFRPHEDVPALYTDKDGSLYMEIIKYSSLLERAQRRNQLFIEKLTSSPASGQSSDEVSSQSE